jgi:hypothetical protein
VGPGRDWHGLPAGRASPLGGLPRGQRQNHLELAGEISIEEVVGGLTPVSSGFWASGAPRGRVFLRGGQFFRRFPWAPLTPNGPHGITVARGRNQSPWTVGQRGRPAVMSFMGRDTDPLQCKELDDPPSAAIVNTCFPGPDVDLTFGRIPVVEMLSGMGLLRIRRREETVRLGKREGRRNWSRELGRWYL